MELLVFAVNTSHHPRGSSSTVNHVTMPPAHNPQHSGSNQPFYGPPPPGYGAPAPKPRKTSTAGAKVMVAVAVFLGLAAVSVFIGVSIYFASTFDSVLNSDGSPGDDVVDTVPLDEGSSVELAGQNRYSLYLVDSVPNNGLESGSTVTTPAGDLLELPGSPGGNYVRYGDVEARSIGSYFAEEGGEYVFEFAATKHGDTNGHVFIVSPSADSDLAFGVLSFVGGIFLGVFLILVALGLGIGGIILWVLRNSAKKSAQRNWSY